MQYHFAALCFADDENISDRVYWYLAPFPVRVGECVLAPVGVHDKLQKAQVVRALFAPEEDAPYPLALIKRIASPYPYEAEGPIEFGGRRYDGRHFTPYHVLNLVENADMVPSSLSDEVFSGAEIDDMQVFDAIMRGHGVLLVGQEGKRIFSELLAFVRGKYAPALPEEDLLRLYDALTRQR